ncbi:MAG: hypothetical protein R2724_34220 [Bryobacterales bacterium]
MPALLFSASVFLNVTLWAFIAAMSISTFVYSNEGESAEGFGLLWYFSVPVWAVASFVLMLAYPWFRAAESAVSAALRYAVVLVAAFAVAPVVWVVWGWVR